MTVSWQSVACTLPAVPRSLSPRTVLPALLIAASSLAGAAVFPLSGIGRTTLASVSKDWLLLLAASWILLAGWAILYTLLLHRLFRIPVRRSLFWAALCHTPLLLCLSLAVALYSSDLSNHVYSNSPYGRVIFQPLARGYVFLAPTLAQILLISAYRPRLVVRTLPIAGIILVALTLRLWNLNWELPALYHPDEHHYIGLALVMMRTGDPNPHYFQNPSLLIYVDYLLARVLSQQAQSLHVIADFFQLGVLDPRGDYLVDLAARGVSAVAGTLTVLVVYLTGKTLFGVKTGVFAAGILAASFLHVRDSHYATNDVLATFFLSLSFLYSARIYTKGSLYSYLLAALFGGLGTATKYNIGFFAVGILLAHLARARDSEARANSLRYHLPLLASGLTSVVAFLAATPFALLDWSYFSADFRTQYGFGGSLWPGQENLPSVLLYFSTLVRGFGLIPVALAGLGVLLIARQDKRLLAVLASVPVAYLLFMSVQQLVFARFAIPLLPFLALFAGYGVDQLGQHVPPSPLRLALPLVVLTVAVAEPLAVSLQHNALLGRDDTRTLAVNWIESNIPPSSTIIVEGWTRMTSPFEWRSRQPRNTSLFWPTEPQDAAEVLRGDFDYVVVSSFGYWSWQRVVDPTSGAPPLYVTWTVKES